MSVPALGHIGPAETTPVQPVRLTPRVGGGRTIFVRPVAGADPIAAPKSEPAPMRRHTRAEPPSRGTAHQSNADGDAATFSSRMNALTDGERDQLTRLRSRDAEVRTHEQAHLAAAGGLALGGASYEFRTGPDGEKYAVGGHVSIDTSPGASPRETIAKAQQVKRAALAPANPSGADRAVAAKAARMEAEARAQMLRDGRAAPGAPSAPAARDTGASLDLVA